ncbi:MAG: glycerate kinase [Opitutia bacterium]
MRLLVASDKFKGSLRADEACRAIRDGLAAALPGARFDLCPIADGGEGTTAALVEALGGEWRQTQVTDARGRPLLARHGAVPARRLAILEMSAASGLALVGDLPQEPAAASTFGTGELLLAASEGADEIVLGIGGSATNDGGLGMALALGWTFRSADGAPFQPTLANVTEAARLAPPARRLPAIRVACDVDNPLLGPRGATRVYGPQKGVRDFAWFEARLAHLADLARDHLGRDLRDVPGAGAAGGLGFGLMAFAQATLCPGFGLVADALGLESRMRGADLVITGEGRLDRQSLSGKGPGGVAEMARRLGKPVVAFAGSVEPAAAAIFDLAAPISSGEDDVGESMRRAGERLRACAERHAGEIRLLARG